MLRRLKFNSYYKIFLLIFALLIIIFLWKNKSSQASKNVSSISILTSDVSIKLNQLLKKICDPTNLKVSPQCSASLKKFDEKLDYLYVPISKDDCNQCAFGDNNEKQYIYYHTFWKLSSPSNYELRVLKLNLMSYLATQNLCCTRFFFWKLTSFPESIEKELKKLFSFYIDKKIIQFKLFTLNSICKTSALFQNHDVCKNSQIERTILSAHSVGLSDFIRFFVLEQYGGIYTDGDVMYLKNMQLLWYFNFAYRWSFTSLINTAVLGINRKFDSSIDKLYKSILSEANGHSLISSFHPNEVSRHMAILNNGSIYNFKSLETLHGYLFDAAWLCYDGIEGSLTPKSVCNFEQFTRSKLIDVKDFNLSDFFPGAFTYHIHLKNADTGNILSESYFAYFEKYFKSILKLKNE